MSLRVAIPKELYLVQGKQPVDFLNLEGMNRNIHASHIWKGGNMYFGIPCIFRLLLYEQLFSPPTAI